MTAAPANAPPVKDRGAATKLGLIKIARTLVIPPIAMVPV